MNLTVSTHKHINLDIILYNINILIYNPKTKKLFCLLSTLVLDAVLLESN